MDENSSGGMKGLEAQWGKLRLSEEEKVIVDVGEEAEEEVWEQGERSVIGKICMERLIGSEIISLTMGKIWRINKPAEFREVGDNKFVVIFRSLTDKLLVMDGRPWLFDTIFCTPRV
ncbi:hypothetical protein CIPAW_04G156400 [Carya illinoinensis]|uniref:DUF4283 domain-containing protein n=1 Tax=Carya illinoinensis TaxID=32201 RepID=A0A8T1QVG6_CARIL|nr:hypothetical protein CIPAW_04G156400 [Carya illinoinensis]